jgi:hypothetical protein
LIGCFVGYYYFRRMLRRMGITDYGRSQSRPRAANATHAKPDQDFGETALFRRGTIIIAWKFNHEIVASSDGLGTYYPNPEEGTAKPSTTIEKVVVCPKQPMFIAASGQMDFATEPARDPRSEPPKIELRDLLAEYCTTIRYERQLEIRKIRGALVTLLRPRIEDSATYDGDINRIRTLLLIGFISSAGPTLASFQISKSEGVGPMNTAPTFQVSPEALDGYWQTRGTHLRGRINAASSVEQLAEIQVDEIARSIEEEAKIQPPEDRQIGWPIRTVILTSNGARLGITQKGQGKPAWQ